MINYELVQRESKYTFADFLKPLPNGAKVFDFDKVEQIYQIFNVFLLMSERGNLGKTNNLKLKCINDFYKNNKPSLFLRNSTLEIQREINKFLQFYDDDNVLDKKHVFKVEKGCLFDENKNKIIELIPFTQIENIKGSRTAYNHAVYDEINEGLRQLQSKIVAKIDNLISTMRNSIADYNAPREDKL